MNKDTKNPSTDELLQELIESPRLEDFIDHKNFCKSSLSELLQKFLDEKGLKQAAVVRDADLNATFGYQIFTGSRNASRNKILQIAFAMTLSLAQTNQLLRAASANELHCKNRRDAIIIFALNHHYSLQKTNEELYRFSEETIC